MTDEPTPPRPMTYFICGSQRSGSNLLCELLTLTGVAGRPAEQFHPWFADAGVLGHDHAGFENSRWAQRHRVATFPQFLAAIVRDGSTANGVFASKLMWNAFPAFLEKLGELPECRDVERERRLQVVFDRPRFVHLRRRNRVRQAVSWALAAQTGHYTSRQTRERAALAQPRFDLQFLDNLYRLVCEADAGWSSFFERSGIEPPDTEGSDPSACRIDLWYEDFAADMQSSLAQLLDWLGVASEIRFDVAGVQHEVQATALNAQWEARYRAVRPDA